MDCRKAYALINEYLDGTLSPGDAAAFDRHVGRCPACAREMEAYRSLGALLGDLDREEAPSGLAEPVIQFLKSTGRIREARVGREVAWARAFEWLHRKATVPVVAAAVVLIAFTAVSIFSGSFLGMVGKSTVAAKDVYIDAQQTISEVQVLDGVSDGIQRDMRTAKTVANAVYLLLSVAGQVYMIPALIMFLMVTVSIAWYLRTVHRRGDENASYCI
jgi:anti-sigma factor RsiW